MSKKEYRRNAIIELSKSENGQDKRIFNIIYAVYRLVVDELNKTKEQYTNDYDNFCNLLMNFEYEDMTTEQVENIRNLVTNLLCDCEIELRNRGRK